MAYTKTIWENSPSENTPISAENLNNIENGIDDVDARLTIVEKYLTATAGSNGDFKVNIPNTLATGMILNITFPVATVSTANARLSIDDGVTYKNLFISGIQALGNEVQSMSLILRYDGTNFVIKNQLEITRMEVETETNEILDGKRVYKKKINLGTFPNTTTKQVPHGLTNVTFLRIDGFVRRGILYATMPYCSPISLSASMVAVINGANIDVIVGDNRIDWSGTAILYYTKN